MRTYAGIGARGTHDYVLPVMTRLGAALREDGYVLRSGHAPGADQAFELGAFGQAEIFLPWAGFEAHVPVLGTAFTEVPQRAFTEAEKYHEGWYYLSRGSRALAARNMCQVLGPNLDDPVEFVICWTHNASKTGRERHTGGTGQALRAAVAHRIPVFNLCDEADMDKARGWIG